MKRLPIVVLLMLSCSMVYSDTIYLDSGESIEGDIYSADKELVIINSDSGKEEINRKYIKRISYSKSKDTLIPQEHPTIENNVVVQKTENKELSYDSKAREQETSLKICLDNSGTHTFDGKVNLFTNIGNSLNRGSSSQDVNTGVSLVGETVFYTTPLTGYGFGVCYQLPRGLTKNSDGTLNFTPIYGIIKLKTSQTDHNLYIVGHLGYNLMDANDKYKGIDGKVGGGIYYGIGAGLQAKAVNIGIMYTVNKGTLVQNTSGYNSSVGYYIIDVDGTVEYSKISISLGITFDSFVHF